MKTTIVPPELCPTLGKCQYCGTIPIMQRQEFDAPAVDSWYVASCPNGCFMTQDHPSVASAAEEWNTHNKPTGSRWKFWCR